MAEYYGKSRRPEANCLRSLVLRDAIHISAVSELLMLYFIFNHHNVGDLLQHRLYTLPQAAGAGAHNNLLQLLLASQVPRDRLVQLATLTEGLCVVVVRKNNN